ncbi:MAG: hypothetical protein FI707_10665 [SAR202 cluster bacterium]|jgi:hypothetical protein|nr:hypothetical protein [Chloroflexota bacterium]MDP6419839.1 hypothetical protein [SAR202 cluster bacterium]HAL48554.1 hypothetical protein [Dehalococcoidia bacterium]MDP6665194.1 hypothetical protein [SAR202 cluster bacterium]MDP6800665.1 hypothetical protein [SAR202 cluster bacterium]|tara:strand:- start:2699 stop:4054 length:1356 start_codon:yes stop_codon:yes gene_type:complete
MIEFEKRGIPTTSWTADGFIMDAMRSAENFGMTTFSISTMPLPFTNQSPEGIDAMVDGSIDQVVSGLTEPTTRSGFEEEGFAIVSDPVLTFEGSDLLDAMDAFNRTFIDWKWSDGLPLVPPTVERVERMLQGTILPPQEVIARLEPGFGIATVEKIAANAVMAGCSPDHLPIVITAVQCIAEPQIYLRNKAMSTGPHAPLIVVNGPIAKEIGLNSGVCALGPGAVSHANTVIGRALRLVMMNVGFTYPGVSDMDTIGSPIKYSMCVAENEAESPWEPYHVAKGFRADESTVTVHFVYGTCELHDFENWKAEELAHNFASAACNLCQVPTGKWLLGRRADPRYHTEEKEHHFMMICPEHAQAFHNSGWDRKRLQEEMFRLSRMSFKDLIGNKEHKGFEIAHPELQWLWDSPDTMLPIVETPDCFEIAVVGGAAGRGAFFWGGGGPITKAVQM